VMPKPALDKKIFWDTDIKKLDYEKHGDSIIVRVLERGSMNDWNEIKRYYGHDRIREAAVKARWLSKTTMSFISSLYHIPVTQLRCYTTRQSSPVPWDF
jgi:hypothetical protein